MLPENPEYGMNMAEVQSYAYWMQEDKTRDRHSRCEAGTLPF